MFLIQKQTGTYFWCVEQELAIASLLHDFSRFLGATFKNHEEKSTILAGELINKNLQQTPATTSWIALQVELIIRHHDFLRILSSSDKPPKGFFSPLASLFRLADKTSVSPAEEIERYYRTGLVYKTKFFDPGLTLDFRLAFKEVEKWDQLQYFLLMFAQQPKDFFFAELADVFFEWRQGFDAAYRRIVNLCEEVGVSPLEVMAVVYNFRH